MDNINNKVKKVFYITLFCYAILITNIISTKYFVLSTPLLIIEIIILVILFLKKDFFRYYMFLIIFISSSFEVSTFVFGEYSSINNIVNIVNMPYIDKLGILLLSAMPLLFLSAKIDFGKISKNNNINSYLVKLLVILLMGFFMTVVAYLMNDNGITNYSFFKFFFQVDFIAVSFIFFVSLNLIILISNEITLNEEIKQYIFSFVFAMTLAALTTLFIGYNGYYGITSNKTILMPLAFFFNISLLVFPFYKEDNRNNVIGILGLISLIVTLVLPSPLGGKWWIVLLSIPILVLYKFLKKETLIKKVLVSCIILCIILIVLFLVVNNILTFEFKRDLSGKFGQAINSISFWKTDWYHNLPKSPKYRIDEFINICFEYKEKPLFLLFGKGFGGSLQHHTNTLSWTDAGAFSKIEIENGIFFRLHETINFIFLKFGLFGIYFFVSTLFSLIKNIKQSPYIIIGIYWFIFYFGIYYSLVIGLVCVILGLFEIDLKRDMRCNYEDNF